MMQLTYLRRLLAWEIARKIDKAMATRTHYVAKRYTWHLFNQNHAAGPSTYEKMRKLEVRVNRYLKTPGVEATITKRQQSLNIMATLSTEHHPRTEGNAHGTGARPEGQVDSRRS